MNFQKTSPGMRSPYTPHPERQTDVAEKAERLQRFGIKGAVVTVSILLLAGITAAIVIPTARREFLNKLPSPSDSALVVEKEPATEKPQASTPSIRFGDKEVVHTSKAPAPVSEEPVYKTPSQPPAQEEPITVSGPNIAFDPSGHHHTGIAGMGTDSGKRKWELNLNGAANPSYYGLATIEGYVYAATYDDPYVNGSPQYTSHIYKIDASNGSIKWQRTYKDLFITAGPVLQSNGKLMVKGTQYGLQALGEPVAEDGTYVINTGNGTLTKNTDAIMLSF